MEEIKANGTRKIEVNNQELQKMKENPYALIKFDQNAKQMQQMIQKHKEETEAKKYQELRRIEAIKSRKIEEQRRQERVKKKTTKRRIRAALYIAAGVTLTTLAYKGNENIQGKNEIVKDFREATSNFGIVNYSDGYRINEGTTYVDIDTGVNHMIQSAKEKGMSNEEIAIGLTACINKETAEKALGEENYPTYLERCELYQEAYHSKAATRLQTNIEKGNGK